MTNTPEKVRLNKREERALRNLAAYGGDGYIVGYRLDVSPQSYLWFRAAGLIEEVWTWASTTRPDIRISEKGRTALQENRDGD